MRLKLTKKRVLLGVCLLSVILMLLPTEQARRLGQFLRPVLVPLDSPGAYLTASIEKRLEELAAGPENPRDLAIRALHEQVFQMQQALDRQREQLARLSRWRGRLDDFPCRLIEARVAYAEPLPMRQRRLLDAGSRQGASAGDLVTTRRLAHDIPVRLPEKLAVLGENFVIGRIIDCAAYSATLQLVTDRDFQMPAKLWRMLEPGQQRQIYVAGPGGGLEQRTVRHDGKNPAPQYVGEPIEVQAEGDGRQVVIRQVPATHGIRSGDRVTTSDSAGVMPLGLTFARVTSVEPDKQAAHFVTVYAEPLGELRSVREVLIVQPYSEAGE